MFFKLHCKKWLLGMSVVYRFSQKNVLIVLIGEMVIIINRIKKKWRTVVIYAGLCF